MYMYTYVYVDVTEYFLVGVCIMNLREFDPIKMNNVRVLVLYVLCCCFRYCYQFHNKTI